MLRANTQIRMPGASRVLFLAGAALVLCSLLPGPALAEKVGGFSKSEIESITPLFKRQDLVALAESHPDGTPKAITLAVKINAPREAIFKIFEKPENFYYVSRLFKENKLIQKHGDTTAYSWASRHKFLSVTGTNQMTLFPPRRIDVSIVESSLGAGSFQLNLYPHGKGQTILVLTGVLDVESSEWLIRYLVGVNPSMRQAMNVAIGVVIAKGIKGMAENMAKGKAFQRRRTRGVRKGALRPLGPKEFEALAPLLTRGMVVLSDSLKGGRLRQATVISKIDAPAPKFILAASTPSFYPKMIRAISDIEMHSQTDQATEFSWSIGFSIFGLKSRNRLSFAPDGVIIEGLDGTLEGSQWRWQIVNQGPSDCVIAYHGWVDMVKAGSILEQSVKVEPFLEHGLVAGANLVMLRAVRRVVEKKK
jgi:hypothetical protein